MGEIAKALGEGSAISFRGQEYRLAPLTFEVQAQFELWLESRVWQAVGRAAKAMPADQYQELRSQTAQDVAAGVYSFGMPACVKAVHSPPGQKHLLFLMLKAAPQEPTAFVTPRLVEDIYNEGFEQLAAAFSADADPNAAPPVAPGIAA